MSYNQAARGFSPLYRENETNHCPGCGRTHWIIGRVTAECAFCTTALPLEVGRRETPVIRHKNATVPIWAA